MTWFVTGATGTIGSALLERLDGCRRLRVLARWEGSTSPRSRVAALLGPAGRAALADGAIDVVDGDVTKPFLGLAPHDYDRVTRGLHGVLHIAARTDFGSTDVDAYRAVNVAGVLRATEFAADAGCPLVHVSTAYVSGTRSGLVLEDELDVGQSHRNAYERSKFEAELAVRAAAAELDVPLTVFRPSIVLPDSPVSDVPDGPGPLAYLRLLANLQGRAGRRERTLRYRGDPAGLLNLVPLRFVVDVLARAVTDGCRAGATYHVTAARSIAMEHVAGLMNECLTGLRTRLVPDLDPDSLDRYESLLERSFRMYADYLFLGHEYDRSELVRDFGGADGADENWLRGVYDRHLAAWRSQGGRTEHGSPDDDAVRAYFTEFLPRCTGRRLVPGLETLTADFTVTVPSIGSHELRIEGGVLRSVAAVGARSDAFDFEAGAEALLLAAGGHTKPADLFFQRRVTIRGDLYRALSTATALEEFFRLHPFVAGRAPEPVG